MPKSQIETGNAALDSRQTRQWLVGNFINPTTSLRSTSALEIKWGHPMEGEAREDWSIRNDTVSIAILQKGRIKFFFPNKTVILEKEGDYVIWGVGVPHKWTAEEDCLILTVRWQPN